MLPPISERRFRDLPKDTIVVTGAEMITALGNTQQTMDGMYAGRTGVISYDAGIREVSVAAPASFDSAEFPVLGDPKLKRLSKIGQAVVGLSVVAAFKAGLLTDEFRLRDDIGIDPDLASVAIGYGFGQPIYSDRVNESLKRKGSTTPTSGMQLLPEQPHSMFELLAGFKGHSVSTYEACATGLSNIVEGYRLLKDRTSDVVIAGGFDFLLEDPKLAIGTFRAFRALSVNPDPETASRPYDINRDGFVMGEGGGVVVMERLETALERGADLLAIVEGAVKGSDGFDDTMMDPNRIGRLVRKVNAGRKVDAIFAHATSTKGGDLSEATAYALGLDLMNNEIEEPIPITSTKGFTGHTIGGAGAITAVSAIMAMQKGIIFSTHAIEPDPELVPLNVRPVIQNEANALDNVLASAAGFGGKTGMSAFSQIPQDF